MARRGAGKSEAKPGQSGQKAAAGAARGGKSTAPAAKGQPQPPKKAGATAASVKQQSGARPAGAGGSPKKKTSPKPSRPASVPLKQREWISGPLAWVSRHRYPLIGLAAMIGFFYIFTTAFSGWYIPNDVWSAWQGAQFVDHGWYGAMYKVMPTIAEFPAFPIVLAPFKALSDAFGLTSGFVLVGVEISPARAGAWLLYGPVCLAVASVVVFAGDALAIALGATRVRRMLIAAGLTALAFYTAIWWGHPEDLAATGFLLYGLLALRNGRPRAAGWLTGVALAFNPLVILAVPVLLARLSKATWKQFVLRMLAIPVALLLPLILTDPRATWNAIGEQQNSLLNRHTIFASLGHHVGNAIVYAGPIRSIVVVLVAVAAFLLARRRGDLAWATAIIGAALLCRQVGEPVLNPYYLVPGIAVLGIVMAARHPAARAAIGTATAFLLLLVSTLTPAPWLYSLLVAAGSVAFAWVAWPPAAAVEESAPAVRAPQERRQPIVRIAVACVIVLAAVIGLTAYGRSSSGAQTTLQAQDWKGGVAKYGNYPYGLPIPSNLDDRIYSVTATRVFSDPTLNPVSIWTESTSTKRFLRQAANSANAVAQQWRTLAWIDPAKATSGTNAKNAHSLAATWVTKLGMSTSPYKATWARGPNFCPHHGGLTKTQQGAPDYRMLLWDGCGSQANWVDTDTGVHLHATTTDVSVGPQFNGAYIVTNPSTTKVLAVYMAWKVKATLSVTPPAGQTGWTNQSTIEGQMVLRPTASGYRIWNPWVKYGFSGQNTAH
jgi:hypothetical protein